MPDRVLVGDIGGTNVRLGCARLGFAGHPEVEDIAIMPGDDFPDLGAAVRQYIGTLGNARPRRALFAIAGPVQDGAVQMTNRDWRIDARSLASRLGFDGVRLVNDYAAMARAIPELPEGDFKVFNEGSVPAERAPVLVAGPGTGLGMATLIPKGEQSWRVLTGEGGHAAFAPDNARERALAEQLRKTHGYVSKELVLSGSGLEDVHRALCEIDGVEWQQMSPAEIMTLAEAGDDICRDICQIRAGATMAALGDGALINGTRGGVVITGGVAERLVDWLEQSKAMARFFERGTKRAYMADIPIRLLRSGEAALIGAAALYYDEEIAA